MLKDARARHEDEPTRIRKSEAFANAKRIFSLDDEACLAIAGLAEYRGLSEPLSLIRAMLDIDNPVSLIRKADSSYIGNPEIPSWIYALTEDSREDMLEKCRFPHEAEAVSSFFWIDDDPAIPIIRQAIASHSPLRIRIRKTLGRDYDLLIAERFLTSHGIPCHAYSSDVSSEPAVFAPVFQEAMEGGIALIGKEYDDENRPCFEESLKSLGLQWGYIYSEQTNPEQEEDSYEEGSRKPKGFSYSEIYTINLQISRKTGKELQEAMDSAFMESSSLLQHIIAEKHIRPECLIGIRKLIMSAAVSGDEETVRAIISHMDEDARDITIRSEREKAYDISILNTDIPASLLLGMAEKAYRERKKLVLLFHGGSGTGKSELAKHIASHIGRPLLSYSTADVYRRYWGESERRIISAFSKAMDTGSVLLFDEIECFLSRRDGGYDSSDKNHAIISNTFLQTMDSFSGIMIGTTNHLEHIDRAFMRRFTRIVRFGWATPEDMVRLFGIYFPDISLSDRKKEMLRSMKGIGPGDFASVKSLAEYIGPVKAGNVIHDLMELSKTRNLTWDGKEASKRPIGFR